jgi:DICT domain-containing protein
MSIPPQLWSFTERHQRFFEAKECLAASDRSPCGGRIVRAHIIPRSQLRQIAQRGHIVAVPTSLLAVMKMQQTEFEAKEIGVGEFSTMNCFCAGHDKILFAPIEDAPLVFSSEQLALLHYRAIAAEFYQRVSQQESAASELDLEFDEPQNFGFTWIHTWSGKAFEEVHHALIRTEKLIAARHFRDVGSLVVRFDAPPAVMAAGAFRPQYDFAAKRVQNLADACCYVAMHLLAADGASVLAFTWLRGDSAAERFVRTFAARPREQMASLAVQCAFEHIEHTCMSDGWWSDLKRPMRAALLERVRRANSLAYRRSPRCLSYRVRCADWPVIDIW